MSLQEWWNEKTAAIAIVLAASAGGRMMYVCYKNCGQGKRLVATLLILEAFIAVMMAFAALGLVQTVERIWGFDLRGWPLFLVAAGLGWAGPRGVQMLVMAALTRHWPDEKDRS